MGETTGIEWTDHTFNPWWGCTDVSPGCLNCYAHTLSKRTGHDVWDDSPRRFFGEKHWNEPRHWRSGRVFCASMADVFEMNHSIDSERQRLFTLIEETPHLTWQLLTKRPENIERLGMPTWLRNVWIGTTVEDQIRAALRIPRLREVAFRGVRFLSCEPLLEAVDLSPFLGWKCSWCEGKGTLPGQNWVAQGSVPPNCYHCNGTGEAPLIDWVIVGCESGPGARPFQLDWARDIVAQCATAGVSCFVKQLPGERKGSVIKDLAEFPADLQVREFPRG